MLDAAFLRQAQSEAAQASASTPRPVGAAAPFAAAPAIAAEDDPADDDLPDRGSGVLG